MTDDRIPQESADPDVELVAVLTTGDMGLIAFAKSILESEGIEFYVRGEGLQDLFGAGRLAGGFNYIVGPAEFVVRREDAERASELLRELRDSAATPPEE